MKKKTTTLSKRNFIKSNHSAWLELKRLNLFKKKKSSETGECLKGPYADLTGAK